MKEFISDVIIALAIVVALSFLVKPTIVKESSMENTLFSNEYLILNKMAYVNKDHPEYGDIIVFKSEIVNDEPQRIQKLIDSALGRTSYKLLIKRVIGVEGDVIRIKDGVVYRNGEPLDEDYTKDGYTNGDIEEYTVPSDELFVMGDNREMSLDSRKPEVGTVSEDTVVGKAVVRLFPFNRISKL